ncbi:hypothetical protein GQ53DRAFT_715071 [Thozetella sp. PMI_491]|nr:hypothetical protein GQ53DRAFT_715071 [Thozetella sp. PMI_491]
MASPPSEPHRALHKHACSLCARRKVKCDKGDPCSNCRKAEVECIYDPPVPYRPRKRAGDEELLGRLAAYEDLMRRHNIDFGRYANTWMPSTLDVKLRDIDPQTPVSMISAFTHVDPKAPGSIAATAETERCLWSTLCSELKYPPIQSLRHQYDPLRQDTPTLNFSFPIDQPTLNELHPEPRHIFRLWEVFIEKINPITKIVHVPTLQPRVLAASWDVSKASKSLTAIMFAIYSLVIAPMSTEDCQDAFGESRDELLARYRAATVRALMAADVLITRELEVLQALALFIFGDPESELTYTLIAAAVRLGQRMSLHRGSTGPEISAFEQEMRIRLWWQLHCLDARCRGLLAPGMRPLPLSEFGDVRLPLNVNDADLHPDMAELPVEHAGPTEMMCVLIKFEFLHWRRSSPRATKVFDNVVRCASRSGEACVRLEDEVIDELEIIYQNKYLRYCDRSIPLHNLTHAIVTFTVSRMRFKAHHPRTRTGAIGPDSYLTRQESDLLFESGLSALEAVDMSINGKLSSHLFVHMSFTFQLDVYIYIISELRQRYSGPQVDLAWRLVEDLYKERPEIVDEAGNAFFAALSDLVLEAWEAREVDLVTREGITDGETAPQFVRVLREKRGSRKEAHSQMPMTPYSHDMGSFMLSEETDLSWEYWNDFLQI